MLYHGIGGAFLFIITACRLPDKVRQVEIDVSFIIEYKLKMNVLFFQIESEQEYIWVARGRCGLGVTIQFS